MNLGRQVLEGVTIVSVDEPLEVDVGNAEDFKEAALRAMGDDQTVIIDASFIDFFDSAGMGALLSLQKRVAQKQGTLALAGLNRAVQDVFRMVGFDVVFVTYPDVAQAISALKR